ncbi:LysR family transcriptional regulator [Pseudorhodoferax sp. Leaf267]|uniref:LysR family transcriptional regulator n=1 Tax=Pseudorhodoferax sp. Leaf267 TaxID=1736316 RepID=UPI0006F48AFD|nr:LysR substrate-binding domain-containing protein [Pseudorhodoferax sp. Leaf267]KQP21971.1 hypothetical protein ASF43_24265 [Pseudorhodoferax sp. Leaf267]
MAAPAVLLARLMARARLRHLQLLVRIAELESLQKAAESIGMSQPGATHALAEIETILGVPLFERHSRGMRPSAFGHALLPLVRVALRQLQACAETVASMNNGAAGMVRIAAIGAAVSGLLAQVLPSFSTAHAEVAVDVRPASVDELLKLMEEHSVDLLACRAPAQLPGDLDFVPLLDDRYTVACRAGHPLARRKSVAIDQLAQATWLVPPPTGIAARDFDLLCQALGIVPPACWISGRSVLLTLAMLQQRDLLVFIPRNTIVQLLDTGLLVELPCGPAFRATLPPVGLVVPRDQARCSEAVQRFIAHARHQALAPAPTPPRATRGPRRSAA